MVAPQRLEKLRVRPTTINRPKGRRRTRKTKRGKRMAKDPVHLRGVHLLPEERCRRNDMSPERRTRKSVVGGSTTATDARRGRTSVFIYTCLPARTNCRRSRTRKGKERVQGKRLHQVNMAAAKAVAEGSHPEEDVTREEGTALKDHDGLRLGDRAERAQKDRKGVGKNKGDGGAEADTHRDVGRDPEIRIQERVAKAKAKERRRSTSANIMQMVNAIKEIIADFFTCRKKLQPSMRVNASGLPAAVVDRTPTNDGQGPGTSWNWCREPGTPLELTTKFVVFFNTCHCCARISLPFYANVKCVSCVLIQTT